MSDAILEYVTRLADQLTPDEKQSLVERLSEGAGKSVPAKGPRDLYGIWRGRVPDDFDVDEALREIRGEWEKEWPGVFDK